MKRLLRDYAAATDPPGRRKSPAPQCQREPGKRCCRLGTTVDLYRTGVPPRKRRR
jgi:hypothetical protein